MKAKWRGSQSGSNFAIVGAYLADLIALREVITLVISRVRDFMDYSIKYTSELTPPLWLGSGCYFFISHWRYSPGTAVRLAQLYVLAVAYVLGSFLQTVQLHTRQRL